MRWGFDCGDRAGAGEAGAVFEILQPTSALKKYNIYQTDLLAGSLHHSIVGSSGGSE